MYLLRRSGSGGAVVDHNDDISGSNRNSRIITTLAAGVYTVEATTYRYQTTGNFTLTIRPPVTVQPTATATATPTATPTPACANKAFPCDLAVTAGDGQVLLRWTAEPNHQQHQVFVRNLTRIRASHENLGAVSRHTVTGLTNGEEYRFWVRSRASTSSNWGNWSVSVVARPVAVVTPTPTPRPTATPTQTPTPAPTATPTPTCANNAFPCDLAVTPGDGQVMLTWNAHPSHQEHQVFVRNVSSQAGSHETLGAVSRHTVTGLTNGEEYRFWVSSRVNTGSTWGDWSMWVVATPMSGLP